MKYAGQKALQISAQVGKLGPLLKRLGQQPAFYHEQTL